MIERCVENGERVLVLAHRGELLDQESDKLQKTTGLQTALVYHNSVKIILTPSLSMKHITVLLVVIKQSSITLIKQRYLELPQLLIEQITENLEKCLNQLPMNTH